MEELVKVAKYLKSALNYTKGFEKEFKQGIEGAVELETLFREHGVDANDFITNSKYGIKYIDKLKSIESIKSRDQQLFDELERNIIRFKNNKPNDWVKIFLGKDPHYVKKIDSTHLYYSGTKQEGIAMHVRQLVENKKLYDDLVKWLHGQINIAGKRYSAPE